jgi:hypothetical protein
MKLIHHGPANQTCSRGSRGVGIILSVDAISYWIEAVRSENRGGECVGGTSRFMLLKTNIIKSNSNKTTKIHIVSAYYPDLGKTSVDDFQNFINTVVSSVRYVQKNDLISYEPTLTPQQKKSPHNRSNNRTTWRAQGPYGNPQVNERGKIIADMIREKIIKDMNSCFKHHIYNTWDIHLHHISYDHYHFLTSPAGENMSITNVSVVKAGCQLDHPPIMLEANTKIRRAPRKKIRPDNNKSTTPKFKIKFDFLKGNLSKRQTFQHPSAHAC